MTVTSRQRIDCALRHIEPDRTPIFEYVLLAPVADQLLGRPVCDYVGGIVGWSLLMDELGWEGAVHKYALDQLDLACSLGHDMMYVVPNPAPPCDTSRPAVPDAVPDDPVDRVALRNRRAEETAAPPDEDTFLIYQFLRDEMEVRGVDLPILAPAYAHGVWTDVDLMQTMVLEPEVAARHFHLATDRTLMRVDQYCRLGIEQVGVGGDFAGNRPLIAPPSYRQFIMPEVRRVSQRLHEGGAWAVNASDGDLWSVLDDFLIGCEVDGYLEIDQSAGMDLRRLKEAYGDRIALYGNIDCGNLLSYGSEDGIRRATIECVEAGMGSGGHIFCVSNAITSSVPVRNYVTMLNAYREVFGLPKFRL
ncbi:MAG: hypothetical protein COZ05_11700 [Armatimonadetes bacterium CG_4_10_14_3_um_filter_59_10]|nr:MAG: hypothetical protein COZ05_11700 [Armatimonadetes bacterium CG_4_10_14_3_um_filter_59_10]